MYAGVSRVTERGQITIPESLRKQAKITSGTEVAFFYEDAQIRLVPQGELEAMFSQFRDMAKKEGLTREKVLEEIKTMRKQKR